MSLDDLDIKGIKATLAALEQQIDQLRGHL